MFLPLYLHISLGNINNVSFSFTEIFIILSSQFSHFYATVNRELYQKILKKLVVLAHKEQD